MPLLLAASAGADVIAEWQESAFVGGSNTVLQGRQFVDARGRERTEFFHADGTPAPATFIERHQRTWRAAGLGLEGRTAPVAAPSRRQNPLLRERLSLPSAAVRFSRIDVSAWKQADLLRREGPRARRIGGFRDLSAPVVVDGTSSWLPTSDGGAMHVLEIESPDATAIRVALDQVQLPAGAEIWIQDAEDPANAFGPCDQTTLARLSSGRYWTEAVWSDRVLLSCVLPPGVDPSTVRYSVTRIVHGYEKLADLPRAAGLCHNDVSCQPAWSNQAAAVAGIGSIGDDGFLFCTGCLVAQKDPEDDDPYFLTANHCVRNQTEADTTEYYWFYQTPSCRATPPNPAFVPRSGGGADLLASATYYRANDFSFMRLRQPPAPGAFRAGWSAATPPASEGLAGIHHPDGDYKRISFGNLYGYQSANFWNVRWTSGVTEPGSSGSPLFNAAHQVIGQLYGGNSYCAWKYGTDQYGRFDKTYPIVKKWLVPSVPLNMFHFEARRDYDGDGRADPNLYRASDSRWFLLRSQLGSNSFNFGYAGTMQVVGDYDGDGRADPAVYDPNSGMWYWAGATGGMRSVQFGFKGTWPVPADYNGDGRTEVAVVDTAKYVWYIPGNPSMRVQQFGFAGTIPVAADYDGDGRSDPAVYDPAGAMWYYFGSAQGFQSVKFGPAGGVPVPARYDGDSKTDMAVFDASSATWHIRGTSNGVSQRVFGGAGTIPVPGPYYGGTTANLATYKLSSGQWTILQGSVTQRVQFGSANVPPVGVRP